MQQPHLAYPRCVVLLAGLMCGLKGEKQHAGHCKQKEAAYWTTRSPSSSSASLTEASATHSGRRICLARSMALENHCTCHARC